VGNQARLLESSQEIAIVPGARNEQHTLAALDKTMAQFQRHNFFARHVACAADYHRVSGGLSHLILCKTARGMNDFENAKAWIAKDHASKRSRKNRGGAIPRPAEPHCHVDRPRRQGVLFRRRLSIGCDTVPRMIAIDEREIRVFGYSRRGLMTVSSNDADAIGDF
jgi:hypothetical protein